ncbi:alkaline ceramidase 3-like [Lineus longissimus]|uniref:alkaline ceramidase 3-like n=1 Tax=Lineus longissimus TaxID=88925 RepID=UPI002B4DB463
MPPTTAETGFWGEVTSTIDWCENNYEVHHYIAEFWNTVSNCLLIIPAITGLVLSIKDKAETRFILCYIGLLVVGLGSWCFHMTLRYEMQLLDELPMLWGGSCLIYSIIEVGAKPNVHNKTVIAVLTSYCSIVTLIYLISPQSLLFQLAFGLLVTINMLAPLPLFRKYQYSKGLAVASYVAYFSAFLVWIIDTNFCPHVRLFRENMFSPIRPFTQLHAWWHAGAGMGTYMATTFTLHARGLYLKKNAQLKIAYGMVYVRQDKSP